MLARAMFSMTTRETLSPPRWLLIGSVIFALFVLFDIVLFGWLILKSLSQREIEKVLLETREEAEPLAERLAAQAESLGQEDLYVVVSVTEETQTYIDAMLEDRDVVRKVQIRDRLGNVVYEQENRSNPPVEEGVRLRGTPISADDGPRILPRPSPDMVEVPIGELGMLVIGLSEEEVSRRVGVLRSDLIQQASLIGFLTITLLLAAFAAIWWLYRRSRRLETQARDAERMAYIGTLASGLAHEIRNPLNSLSLNMQMLEEDAREAGPVSGASHRLVSITRSEIRRLEGLVTDFLTYAKPRPIDLEEMPVDEIFERLLEVLAAEIRAQRATVEIDDQTDGAEVRVDPSQIGQLLLNLTQNALLATAETESPRVVLRARWDEPGERVAIEIVDNGCGMGAEEAARIFEIFYSTRKGGTGLGLAIAQRIAHAHQTEIEVESALGRGTTMRLRLAAASWIDAEAD